jgi:hypothetical protein
MDLLIALPFELIQAIRLTHALMESDNRIFIPVEHLPKFSLLSKVFALPLHPAIGKIRQLPSLEIVHNTPLTRVGRLSRPLIFPHQIFDYLRQRWLARRPKRIVFSGLITDTRKKVISEWYERQFAEEIVWPRSNQIAATLNHRVLRRLRLRVPEKRAAFQQRGLLIRSSEKGRKFPGKAWDQPYFDEMLRSQFVLCPNGDYVWTYRFFEAAMCGAIPVVQDGCPAYDEFRYLRLSDSLEDLSWDAETAEHNFELCRRRLTLDREELNREIEALLAEASAEGRH